MTEVEDDVQTETGETEVVNDNCVKVKFLWIDMTIRIRNGYRVGDV